MSAEGRWTRASQAARDATLFFAGLYGLLHEIQGHDDRQWLIAACLGMVGLPLVIRTDERRRK